MDLFLFGFFLGFSQSRKVNEAGESGLAVASDGLIGVGLVGVLSFWANKWLLQDFI